MQCSVCSRSIWPEEPVKELSDVGLPVHCECFERQTGHPAASPAPTLAAYLAARRNAAA